MAEHLADVLRSVPTLLPRALPLAEAAGRVLAEDVTAPLALPPFDNSSMDGYAVRTADVAAATAASPVVLRVVGEVAAGGGDPRPAVGPGEAARIMTGAPLPPGAQAVVPVEWTDGGAGPGAGPADAMPPATDRPGPHSPGSGGEVRVFRPATAGQHIRERGSDILAGATAVTAGTPLTPPRIGLLAAVGRASATVHPRPRVVVISTGSELTAAGQPLAPGQIHDSNGPLLTAAAERAGATARQAPAVADDPDALRAVLAAQLGHADLVVTSGGVSVGAYDVVKAALSEDGGVAFRRLAMQPGKPQGFGLLHRPGGPRAPEDGAPVPLFALPGNPVSAYVSFELFVRPALRAMAGHPPERLRRPRATATLDAAAPLTSPLGKRQFLRGHYTPPGPGEATGTVRPVGGASSHLIAALAEANALIEIEEATTEVRPRSPLAVVLLD